MMIKRHLLITLSLISISFWGFSQNKPRYMVKKYPQKWARSLVMSKDGQFLASHDDFTIHLWNAKTGYLIREFIGHTDDVMCMAISPDGKWLASGSQDNTMKLWNIATGQVLHTFHWHNADINSVNFTDSGKFLVGCSDAGRVAVYELANKKRILNEQLAKVDRGILMGTTFIGVGGSWSYTSYNLRTGDIKIYKMPGYTKMIAASKPSGRFITSDEDVIDVWDSKTFQKIKQIKVGDGDAKAIAISPDGKWVAAQVKRKQVNVWSADSGELVSTIKEDSNTDGVCFGKNSKVLYICNVRRMYQWDVIQKKHIIREGYTKNYSDAIKKVSIHPTTQELLISQVSNDRVIRQKGQFISPKRIGLVGFNPLLKGSQLIFNNTSPKLIDLNQPQKTPLWDKVPERDIRTGLRFNNAGNAYIYQAYERGKLRILVRDLTGKLYMDYVAKGNAQYINRFDFHPASKLVVFSEIGRYGGEVTVVDGNTNKILKYFELEGIQTDGMGISPDGKKLYIGTRDGNIIFYDPKTGKMLGGWQGHAEEIRGLAFHPTQNILATAAGNGGNDNDGDVKVWDATTGNLLFSRKTGRSAASLYFSPDGKQLLVGKNDGSIDIFDVKTGEKMMRMNFFEKGGYVFTMPNGKFECNQAGLEFLYKELNGQVTSVTMNDPNFVKDIYHKMMTGALGKEITQGKAIRYVTPQDIVLKVDNKPLENAITYDKESIQLKGVIKGNLSVARITINDQEVLLNEDKSFESPKFTLNKGNNRFIIKAYMASGQAASRRVDVFNPGLKPKAILELSNNHKKFINTLAYHPGNKYIITGGIDKKIKVWDLSLRQVFRTFDGHSKPVLKVQVARNGKYLVSASETEVIIWTFPRGVIVKKITTEKGDFAILPDSKRVLVSETASIISEKEYVHLFNLENGQPIKVYKKKDDVHILLALTQPGKLNQSRDFYIQADDNYIEQVNFKTGKDQEYKHNGKEVEVEYGEGMLAASVTQLAAFSKEEKKIFIWDIINPERTTHVIPISENNQSWVKSILFTHNGKFFCIVKNTLRVDVYNAQTMQKVRTFDLGSRLSRHARELKGATKAIPFDDAKTTLQDVVMSPDDQFMMATVAIILKQKNAQKTARSQKFSQEGYFNYLGVNVVDFKSGQGVTSLGSGLETIESIYVSNDEKYLVTTHKGLQVNGTKVWDLKRAETIAFMENQYGMLNPNRKILAMVAPKKSLTLYRFPSLKKIISIPKPLIQSVRFTPDGNKLVVINSSTIEVMDISNKSKPKVTQSMNIYFQETGYSYSPIQAITSANGKHLLMTVLMNNNRSVVGHAYVAVDMSTGKTQSMYYGERYNRGRIIAALPNSTSFLIAEAKIIVDDNDDKFQTKIQEIDYATKKLKSTFVLDYESITTGAFSKDGKYLVLGTGSNKATSGQLSHFDVVMWNWETKKMHHIFTGHQVDIVKVWFGARNKHIYSLDKTGIINIWDIEKKQLAATLISFDKFGYTFVTPDNYYKASKNLVKTIGFRYNDKLYAFGQFDIKYHRPDLVIKRLKGSKIIQRLYKKAWKKRLKREGMTESQLSDKLLLPSINILGKYRLPISTKTPTLGFQIKAQSKDIPLKNIQLYVNGTPIYGSKGLAIKPVNVLNRNIQVSLSNGENNIEVWVTNQKGYTSARESIRIEFNNPRKQKGNLYVLGIGVSKYTNEERNLKYAQKDVEDLSKTFQQAKNYQKVFVQKFINEDATRKNILSKANKFLAKATINDQVIIFVSCHGLLDNDLNYFLAMHNVDFDKPAKKGLPYEVIEELMDKTKARKRLIMIDACHSGELDKSAVEKTESVAMDNVKVSFKGSKFTVKPKAGLKNSFEYMKALFNDISNSAGATVISAAAGYEFALESQEWNNGVFTYSVLEGFKSGKADLDKDGKITLSELKQYVIDRVTTLTKGQQVPTTRRENQNLDVVIFKK